MIAKLGFVLIVAAFGALMFIAGILAPASVRQPVGMFAQQTIKQLTPVAEKKIAGDAASAAAAASSSSAPQAEKSKPVPAESLLIPSPLPDKGQYALQAGQFTHAEQANALAAHIKELGLPFDKVIDVVDQAGKNWSVVPVGPYGSLDEARTVRLPVARNLGMDEALPLILLPQAPKS